MHVYGKWSRETENFHFLFESAYCTIHWYIIALTIPWFFPQYFWFFVFVKVMQNSVKRFLNETVKKSCFHVDLWMLKYIWHFQCSVDTRNWVNRKKYWKSVLVLDFISSQHGQFTTSVAFIGTAGKPSSRGPQTTFTINHKPQSYLYEFCGSDLV